MRWVNRALVGERTALALCRFESPDLSPCLGDDGERMGVHRKRSARQVPVSFAGGLLMQFYLLNT
jgi:hypothetical protein